MPILRAEHLETMGDRVGVRVSTFSNRKPKERRQPQCRELESWPIGKREVLIYTVLSWAVSALQQRKLMGKENAQPQSEPLPCFLPTLIRRHCNM
jgi:hypothetical protein